MKDKELITALEFFNDTGLILFRNDIENENKNAIILDVQWFVDAFKCIIMDKEHFNDPLHYEDFDALYRNGLLSSNLLMTLWNHSNFYSHKSSLVKHMMHLDMLAELEPGLWYVPCMNKQKFNQSVLDNCNVSSTLCFVFKFLPCDIYHRLIGACINKLRMELWKLDDKYCIYHRVTILKCKNTTHRVIIGIGNREKKDEYPYSIEIQAIETKPRNPQIQFCSKIKENIYRILLELTRTLKSSGAHFLEGYLCTKTPHKDPPQGHIILEDALKRKDVDCYKCKPVHMVDGKSILGFWKLTENKQSSGGIETDSVFYQRDPEAKKSQMVRSNGYGMEQIHKDALRRTRVMLVTNLDVNIIYDELLGKDIFTPPMMEHITNERTRIDKVRRLLEDLPRRGSNAYHDFLKVLRETGYKYLANEIVENEEIIRRENARKESSNDQPHPDGLVVHGKGLHRLSSIVSEQLEDIVLPDIDEKPVKEVTHISYVTSEIIWIENKDCFMKIDHSGRILFKREIKVFWGCSSFTVDKNGDVFYIEKGTEVIKMSSTGENPTQLLKVKDSFTICNICSARLTGEILIRVYFLELNKHSTYIERYNKNGERLSQFKYNEYEKLHTSPWFVSVNINGNICVSDQFESKVQAFDEQGTLLYSYGGFQSQTFDPLGICNDLLGHVLVCNCHSSNPSVHLLHENGEFLKMIVCGREDVKEPWGLCADNEGKLYLGQKNCSVIKVFKYLRK